MKNQSLIEALESENLLGFSKALRARLLESMDAALEKNISLRPLRVDESCEAAEGPEKDAVELLCQTARQLSGYDMEYEEGLFEVYFDTKQAATDFADFCEQADFVDTYEIEVYTDDNVEVEEIELDDIEDSDGYTFEVYAYLDPDIVSYPPVELDESVEDENGTIYEVKRVIKINARGKRRIKMQCRPGFKWDANAKTCRKISGSEMVKKRRALRKAVRTKKAKGASYRVRILRKTRKAKMFRKRFGLN